VKVRAHTHQAEEDNRVRGAVAENLRVAPSKPRVELKDVHVIDAEAGPHQNLQAPGPVHGEQARHGAESRKGRHRIDGQFAAHGVEALSGEKVTSKEYKFQP